MAWTVPGYVVEELVGAGSSGEVWRGRSVAAGEVVALKRLPVADAHALLGARSEAAVLAALEHPHILRLRELLISEGEAILVTDYAAGGSLAGVLEHRGRLSPGEVVTVVAPIAAALAHAHAEGVVHGDVSAANILFTDRGQPVLADLGVARIVGRIDTVARATPEYVDPLVVRGAPPGPHSDVFALAAVAFHALTGAAPWAGESPAESLAHAADGGAPALRSVAPHVPEALAQALDRALQDNGLLRGSAAELALDSRHAVTPIPVEGWTARPASGGPASSPAAWGGSAAGAAASAGPGGRHSAPEAAATAAPGGRPPFRRVEPPPAVSPSARTRIARREGGPAAAADRAGTARARASVLAPAGPRRRWATALLAGAAVLASVAAGGWWAQRDSGADPQRPVTPLARTSAPVPPAVPVAVDWLAELTRLDAARERAYAERDPARLAEVYASPVLLEQDRAQLGAQVPPDCGLDGARTQYTQLEVDSADGARASVRVTARLEAARVLCHGALQATTDPVGPVRLAIILTAGGDGRWRIEDQRLAG